MRNNRTVISACIFVAAGLVGCARAGDKVLVFGTDTKIALDLSSGSPTKEPSITLGWSRHEAVWLPLIADAGSPTKFVGKTESKAEDAYSVMASFGFSSSGSDAKIAQYLATGIAARELARSGGAQLVSTEVSLPASALEIQAQEQSDIDLIVAHVAEDDAVAVNKDKFNKLIEKSGMSDGRKNMLKSEAKDKRPDELRRLLSEPRYTPFLEQISEEIPPAQ